ncbi:MAG: alpha/beta hydrolase [Chitinophagales bacterium]|nr:alpha/beta hydrolase [Bacteroidota bacterium]
MRIKKINILFIGLFATILATLTSCDPKPAADQLDNYYFVKVGDVALPVRVCGNINSDIAIVFVHGGPGGSAQAERQNIYWKEIEKYYKVIYYDQRGSGITQGNAQPEDMSIEQFSKDLDVIVNFAKEVAKTNKVFIHGTSWGGGLTTYYLLDTAHQNKLQGAIIECPAYDIVDGTQLSIQWILQKADSNIAIGKNVAYWNNCKNFYALHPTLTANEFKQHQLYLNQEKGILYNTTNVQSQETSIPKYEISVLYNNAEFAPKSLTYQGQSIFTHLDLTAQLHQIKLPILLVWGAKDGLLPKINLAQQFVSNVGSSDLTYNANKYLLSAHIPHAEEWQQFNTDAKAFIEAHK